MKTIIAMDSFKGCLSSLDAGNTIKEAILSRYPSDSVEVFPLADGGEGTVDVLTAGLGGDIVPVTVTGPLGQPVASRYGWLPKSHTAIIEMADASGLPLVPPAFRNPMNTTTYGLGELISAALSRGCRHFIIGIGGSATNDAGIGMLTALDYHFYQEDGSRVKGYGRDLAKIVRIDDSEVSPLLRECRFDIACDVTNPLCGSEGCSHVFGPQKGATPEIAARMDADIARFAALAERFTGNTAALIPGAGAAGGLGFAFHTFLNGSLTPGITLVLEAIHIADALPSAHLAITARDEWIIRLRWVRRLSESHSLPSAARLPAVPSLSAAVRQKKLPLSMSMALMPISPSCMRRWMRKRPCGRMSRRPISVRRSPRSCV